VPRIAWEVLAVWKRAINHRGARLVTYYFRSGRYVLCERSDRVPVYYSPSHIIDTTEEDLDRWQRINACATYKKIELGFYDGKYFKG
jgi:hypothetical protein